MDVGLIRRINSYVKPGDDLYILGDVALSKPAHAIECVRQLNGQKFLVAGNHDKSLLRKQEFRDLFAWVKDLYTVTIADPDAGQGKQRIVLCHYAMRVWDRSHYGTWHLYGHSHGTLPEDPHTLSLDVGLDANSYLPWSYHMLKGYLSTRRWAPVDHHGR
jgi:calcineurin-like phosphoesterase family protein